MAQCVVIQNVNGTDVFVPSSADPCTTLLLLNPVEYSSWVGSPLNLSAADGLTLSGAILGVWAIAWSFRALLKAVHSGEALDS